MLLGFEETKKLLEKYKIPFAKSFLAKNKTEALGFAKLIGYPVVLKAVSPNILHRTDIGAIKTNINNQKELKSAYLQILKSAKKLAPKAKIEGVMVQEQKPGIELIVGGKIDPVFGPTVMFGLGGIFVEVFKDTSFRLSPITQKEAREMIREIKGFKILTGFRKKEPVNLKAIEKILLKVSNLISRENIKEIDLNPIIANKKEAVACDVKIII